MLSRRHLRIRVMQALYAYFQSEQRDIQRTEQELLNGTRKIFELYLMVLQFFIELAHQEEMYYDDLPNSAVTGLKKKAEKMLKDNRFIAWLSGSKNFEALLKQYKISWQPEADNVKKAFFQIRQLDQYKAYISSPNTNPKKDDEFINWVYKEVFENSENIRHLLEERTIYWAESLGLVESMLHRTIESGKSDATYSLLPLYKDEEDDILFMRDLVKKTIRDDAYFQQMIADKTKNWDADRIALVDIILMKMALCEILNISNIPVKVSINEYIDISKDYSTPNSKAFINGVIDKLVIELREQGKIVKTGRGLVE
ncbi:transcription antitermination factor NusB [soil metagenome]